MLMRKVISSDRPVPTEFLEWQVKLRAWTMVHQHGSPHAGVAPLIAVGQPGIGLGVTMHSIICGLLPHASQLAAKTAEFRGLYENNAGQGARAIYDAGIEYLKNYYKSAADFDPTCITSLLHKDAPVVQALRANATCSLLFYVFDLDNRTEEGRFRCLQMNGHAELHPSGPLYDNVWWHNAVFHGKLDDQVMVRFVHSNTYDTKFGGLDAVDA